MTKIADLTTEQIVAMRESATSGYRATLEAFGKRMPKKTREDLLAGFQDGLTAMLVQLRAHEAAAPSETPIASAGEA